MGYFSGEADGTELFGSYAISWPGYCIGCGLSVASDVSPWNSISEKTVPLDRVKGDRQITGRARIYICNSCEKMAAAEQTRITRSRLFSLIISILTTLLTSIIFYQSRLLNFQNYSMALVSFIWIPVYYGYRWSKSQNLNSYDSYFEIKLKRIIGIRFRFRNEEYYQRFKSSNPKLRFVDHDPRLRIANIFRSPRLESFFTCLIAFTLFFVVISLIFWGDTIYAIDFRITAVEMAYYILVVVLAFVIPYTEELVFQRVLSSLFLQKKK